MAQVVGNEGAASGLGPGAGPFGVWGDAGPVMVIAGSTPEPATGVVGTSAGGIGVAGRTNAGTGVAASSVGGAAVSATSTSGTAVSATSTSGAAITATSQQGSAVIGTSSTEDAINGTSSSPVHAGVSANNSANGMGLYASSATGTAGYFKGDVYSTGTIHADVNVTCNGADFAEDFDVVTLERAEPGSVMVVTSDGTLTPSTGAYDKRVAGVLSGAGTYKPGLILDRTGTDGMRMPVALLGKVFCKVDASYGAIGVGDLLTTSPTPGHAMAATDPSRAFGAVIGKALQPLAEGRGLIPILVALQ